VDVAVDMKVDSEFMAAKFGPLSGQVISALKSGCNKAFLKHSQRYVKLSSFPSPFLSSPLLHYPPPLVLLTSFFSLQVGTAYVLVLGAGLWQ